jgi:hypothetical protein
MLGGAGLRPAQAIAPTPTAASRADSASLRGARRIARTVRAASPGTVARSTSASPSSWTPEGSGRGSQRSPGSGGAAGSEEVSKSTVTMSTPEIPSTSAWWVLARSAKRPPATPCTSHSSQSGLSRSSCCENTLPASARSCSSEPGEGRAVSRTW